jgi:hypothetical protein
VGLRVGNMKHGALYYRGHVIVKAWRRMRSQILKWRHDGCFVTCGEVYIG